MYEFVGLILPMILIFLIAILVLLIIMLVGLITSKKEWSVEYQGNLIRVTYRNNRETLYVNAEIQDENVGIFSVRSKLWGKLPTGEEVKISLGFGFRYRCNIFVDRRLILQK